MLDKLSKINNSGEPEFIKGKYILEFLEQDEQGWSLIDAREKRLGSSQKLSYHFRGSNSVSTFYELH